jgi:hypothetical protein
MNDAPAKRVKADEIIDNADFFTAEAYVQPSDAACKGAHQRGTLDWVHKFVDHGTTPW